MYFDLIRTQFVSPNSIRSNLFEFILLIVVRPKQFDACNFRIKFLAFYRNYLILYVRKSMSFSDDCLLGLLLERANAILSVECAKFGHFINRKVDQLL